MCVLTKDDVTAQRNMEENLAELLGTDSKNILRSHPPVTTIVSQQDTQSALNVSPLLTGNHRESQKHPGGYVHLCK